LSVPLSPLKYCFTGGDVLPMDVLRRWTNHYNVRIHQGYGATETCGGVIMVPVTGNPPEASIGTVMPEKDIKIVDPETLEEVEPGQPGELLVRSDRMVECYWNKEEETQECFVQMENALWYKTGDIVSFDEQGYMYFVDRTADITKHKGYRISASEIEAAITACVMGIPDERVGQRIKAYVVLKEDSRGATGIDPSSHRERWGFVFLDSANFIYTIKDIQE
jgi:long-chain acyl-CoA synthetase